MKYKTLIMFLILQLLLIITNYQDVSQTILSFDLSDILKILITTFSIIYILFSVKNNFKNKLIFSGIVLLTLVVFIFKEYSTSQLLTNFYYISSFSFILFYFIKNKANIINNSIISTISLLVLDIVLLINNQSGLSIELLIIILLSFIFLFYNLYKKIFIPIYLLTIIVAIINDYNLVLYYSLLLSIITIVSYRNNRDLLYGSIFVLFSTIILGLKNLLSFDKLINTFDIFYLNINIDTFIISVSLIILICYLITKCIQNKIHNIYINQLLMVSIFITTLMFISLDNVYNEFVILFYALLIVTIIEMINNSNKKLRNEITFFVLHLGYGGIESSTINTANELSKLYKVRIVSFYNLKRNIENTINIIEDNIVIKHLYKEGPNKEELIQSIKDKNIIKIIKNGYKAINVLVLKQYLIVNEMYKCNSLYTVSTRNEFSSLLSEFGKLNSVKIAQEHMHHRDNKKYINNIKYEFNNINYMFALTESLKIDYEEFLKNNKKTKVLVVPNIIYLPNKKASLKNKNLITISRLNPIKKIDDMIKIFSSIKSKKSKLYIVGDGEELEKLKKKAEKESVQDRVIFTGYKTKEEMEEYFEDSSIFLLTSLSEGLPMVLLESMSYGVPCIAFDTKSGVKDIIDDDVNGFIINGRNKEKYVEKIDELLNNKELLYEFSKNSLKKVKKFTAKEIVKKWQEVLDYEKEK